MRNLILIILTGLIFGCTSATNKNTKENSIQTKNDSTDKKQVDINTHDLDSNYLKIVGDSVEIPSFEIELKLSEKAEGKLKIDNESVIVMAYFSGEPIENIPDKYIDNVEMDELFLLAYPIDLTDKRLAKFENLKFSKELYDLLANKDIRLLINVYSGRKSTDLNLLDCEILQDNMSNIIGKRFAISGKLISND